MLKVSKNPKQMFHLQIPQSIFWLWSKPLKNNRISLCAFKKHLKSCAIQLYFVFDLKIFKRLTDPPTFSWAFTLNVFVIKACCKGNSRWLTETFCYLFCKWNSRHFIFSSFPFSWTSFVYGWILMIDKSSFSWSLVKFQSCWIFLLKQLDFIDNW